MAKVILKSIKKIYPGNVQAVKDFNMEIEDKEFIVLVGPSGCGKTTTLRMVAGLEDISEGELYIGDRLVNDVSAKDRDIAMVFQNYALYPHMSVYDNMAFGLQLRKLPKDVIDEKVKEAAKILEIEHLLDRKPKALSGGQRQRVALGRAIVREPKVFLMDEPLSNLDAKLRVQMRTEITKLHKKLQSTFIYVTHDQVEAMTMGSRIVIMKDGDIQQIDTPQNVYENPENLFVAEFIGSPQINIFNGTVVKNHGKIELRLEDDTPIHVTEEMEKILEQRGYLERKVYVGIRPEHLHEREIQPLHHNYSMICGKIEVAELMGAEKYFHTTISGKQIIARVDSKSVKKSGDDIELNYHWDKVYLFDFETEKRIF
ncbi:ABC transporter ATP-binding protein [Geosporobacter ferrireducens]|uniref:Sugar ABC transporter ATP-binding protein n=1 Tax=Geosporobacter ferrireducens TaxID=1424294 RepID=A0A1D8GED7_9FIRM|nr:sn-glycerol-3-phosphate ABC transporter ATP-binding protein UgpC [Geosporobacter ferrireducens]AOT69265.1 sugar ABC transporter ATP-binding protein [Geosporobacter ferrireducens]MTI56947.1 sn-glycerol-3-phosphate ABC transporter ATP-binding protein UgpC [Geosporobacter ferrireducens]